jgi:hypothetical protein
MAPETPAAARKPDRKVGALRLLIACAAVAAAQALDLRAPARVSAHGAAVHGAIRAAAPSLGSDQPLGSDVDAVAATPASGTVRAPAGRASIGPSKRRTSARPIAPGPPPAIPGRARQRCDDRRVRG